MAVALVPKPDWGKILQSEHIKRWLKQSKYLRILVTGKTGVGKSALVNGIVGKYVAKEGDTLDPETSKVTEYHTTIKGVEVIIYDSPGLQDGTKNEDAYLRDMEEKCKKVDLILYCQKMTDTRIDSGDRAAMLKLSKAFGVNHFWTNTLFVLTFANEVKLPPQRHGDSDEREPIHKYFEHKLIEWQTKLHRILCEVGVERDLAEKVPVVPAGYHFDPSLPATNCEYWLSNLWFKCLDRTADVAKPALLKINWKRLTTSEKVTKEDISQKEIHEQPIIYGGNNMSIAIPPVILEFLGLSSRQTIAGKTGGEIGQLLGGLAGGGIGMEIGGIAGVVLGELIYKYGIEYWQEIIKEM